MEILIFVIVDSCVNMILFRQLFLHKYKRMF